MATSAAVSASRAGAVLGRAGGGLARGIAVGYLSLIVLVPLAALVWSSRSQGLHTFWHEVTKPEASSALKLTLGVSVLVAAFNAVTGTAIAWVLVRDSFPGKGIVNAVIDLPFALPTIVAGLTLLALYGPKSPIGVNLTGSTDVWTLRVAVCLALLFVTLPFVVRTVQPVVLELDREMEEAARSLGANELAVFRRIVLPSILPGILSGVALAFARAVGEIGAIVLISGNLPYRTEMASVYVFNQIESGNKTGASAVAVVLLAVSFAALLGIGGIRRLATRHERA